MSYKITSAYLVFAFMFSALVPVQTQAQSAYEQSIQTVQFQLITAINSGDQFQITSLFQVLLDLLALEDSNFQNRNLSDGRIFLETESANNIEDDEARLRGEINFSGSSDRAYVWFQYGEDSDDLEYETSREFVDEDDDENFSETIEDLDDDERYYYRAVAEDRDTQKLYYGDIRSFTTDDNNRRDNDDEPDVDTRNATDIRDDRAEINGRVDMNDFRNGEVFFVWGEDENKVEDVEDEDRYNQVDEDGDDLQKQRVDSDLDTSRSYDLDIRNLDDDTRIYYTLCVAYEDDDDDEVIDCGEVEDFRTED